MVLGRAAALLAALCSACAHAAASRPVPAVAATPEATRAPGELRRQELALRRQQVASQRRGDPRGPAALLGLAELLLEDASGLWREALARDDHVASLREPSTLTEAESSDAPQTEPTAFFEGAALERLAPEARSDVAAAVALVSEATTVLERLLTEHPAAPQTPEALALLAFTFGQFQHPARARRFWLVLVREHPTSPRAPEGWLAFAEHAFETGAIPQALELYARVAGGNAPRIVPYARYKLAWCELLLDHHAQALEAFGQAADSAAERGEPAPIAREAVRDGLRVLVRARTPLTPEDVLAWRDAHPYVSAVDAVTRVAEDLDDAGRPREALRCWLLLATLDPPRACDFLTRADQSARSTQDPVASAQVAARRAQVPCAGPP